MIIDPNLITLTIASLAQLMPSSDGASLLEAEHDKT